MQRQLPQMTRRLQSTLDKLRRTDGAHHERASAVDWWRDVQQRYAHEGVLFDTAGLPAEAEVPVELFDSVGDNFLQNALAKRRTHPVIRIRATLAWEAGCALSVCDSGDALSEQIAQHLFSAPVPSLQGLGVGLYQSARQATAGGYRLALVSNVKGKVCFALVPAAKEVLTEASPLLPSG
jgi:hypothetical protein